VKKTKEKKQKRGGKKNKVGVSTLEGPEPKKKKKELRFNKKDWGDRSKNP